MQFTVKKSLTRCRTQKHLKMFSTSRLTSVIAMVVGYSIAGDRNMFEDTMKH